MTDAFIDIPGVRNFRDAGGIGTLRRGVLYRSGSFHTLTEEGARRLKELGLRTVIDLRSPFELEVWPDQRHGLDHEALSLPTLPADRGDVDRPWPEDQASLYPFMACLLYTCIRDSTIAVLQSLLGASEADITADFLLSNIGLGLDKGPAPYIDETGAERLSRPISAELIASSLAWIHTHHGTIPAYLRHHGATDAELDAVRANLSA